MGFTIASLSLAGWSLECCPKCVPTNHCQSFQVAVELDLARFWEVEEIPRVKRMSKENRQCGALRHNDLCC